MMMSITVTASFVACRAIISSSTWNGHIEYVRSYARHKQLMIDMTT